MKKKTADAVMNALTDVFAALSGMDPEDSFCVSYVDHRLTVEYTLNLGEGEEE